MRGRGDNKKEGFMNRYNVVLKATLFLLVGSLSNSFAEQLPNGQLEVAYRQLIDGRLSESIHNIVLSCYDERCSMTTLTLNQCFDFPDGKSFYPKIERTSTGEGNLVVRAIEKGIVEVEEKYPSSFKYRFTYKTKNDSLLSTNTGLRNNLWFDKLTGFSGAVIKQSAILKKVVSWELVPLKGESVVVKPACNINLKGVPK